MAIISLSSPVLLRANKQVGLFATNTIDVSNPDTIKAYGRGKKLGLGILSITNSLHGTLGQNTGMFSHVSGVVLESQHERLPKGLIVNLIFGGIEASKIEKLGQEIELDKILGFDDISYQLNLEFNQSTKTQYGTIIYPPSIFLNEATGDNKELCELAYEWAKDKDNQEHIDPFTQYPTLSLSPVVSVRQLPAS